jgi:thiol:disulfide interchange protein
MVRVKQALGMVILATAAYYGYLGYELLSNRWVDATAVTSSVEEKVKEGWSRSLADGLADAEREHKPVLIDMWATWCKHLDDGQDDAAERRRQGRWRIRQIKFRRRSPTRHRRKI